MNMLPFQDVTTGFGGGGGGGTSGYVSGDLTVTGGLTVTDLDVDASVTGNVITLNGGNRTFGVSPLLEVNSSKVEHLVYTNLRHGSELKVLMNAFTQFTLSEISNVNRYHYSGVTTVEAGDIALMTFSNLHGSIYADLKISYGVSTFVVRATGGSVTTYTDAGTTYKVHTFTSSGDFTVTSGGEVEYLIIAGGGGGGSDSSTGGRYGGGGGGAGGYRCSVAGELSGGNSSPESLLNLTNGIYTVTVGAGGAGGNYTSAPGERGTNGNDSSLSTIVSFGGGGGSGSYTGGDSGGSGGGGAEGGGPGSGTANQGFSGGVRGANDGNGGGGGAGGAGGTSSTDDVGGSGGVGISSNINGTLVGRAGGGGGSTNGSASDGGGSGANGSGTINTGGGGGASENNNSSGGGSGGSGIVIIRYAI
jgi:hypothetical protein